MRQLHHYAESLCLLSLSSAHTSSWWLIFDFGPQWQRATSGQKCTQIQVVIGIILGGRKIDFGRFHQIYPWNNRSLLKFKRNSWCIGKRRQFESRWPRFGPLGWQIFLSSFSGQYGNLEAKTKTFDAKLDPSVLLKGLGSMHVKKTLGKVINIPVQNCSIW